LAIYITGFIKGDILRGYEDFSNYGIPENELRAQVEQNLTRILNYPESKFKHDDFGVYEVAELK
jgi:hypothetical protein